FCLALSLTSIPLALCSRSFVSASSQNKARMAGKEKVAPANVRRYFIAAEPITWNYAPSGRDINQRILPKPWRPNPTYQKFHYVQYTDETFKTKVEQPPWLGLLGPIIRGVVGDTLMITFFNRTNRVFSMHPHGLRYDKDSEGSYYAPDPGR